VLDAVQQLGPNAEEYLHVLVPAIVKIVVSDHTPLSIKTTAVETLSILNHNFDLGPYASRIVLPTLKMVQKVAVQPATQDQRDLLTAVMDLFSSMFLQLGTKFMTFYPIVDRVIRRCKIQQHQRFDLIANKVSKNTVLSDFFASDPALLRVTEIGGRLSSASTGGRLHHSTSRRRDKLVGSAPLMPPVQRLRRQPTPRPSAPSRIRNCNLWCCNDRGRFLRPATQRTGKQLFNAAFVSCWSELPTAFKTKLIQVLEQALSASKDVPEISQTILNTCPEFMDHRDSSPLPLSVKLLADKAIKTRVYAKALYYKETEFRDCVQSKFDPSNYSDILESLISINNKLGMVVGRLRCLEALGEWTELEATATEKWSFLCENTDQERDKVAAMAINACWSNRSWDKLCSFLKFLPKDSYDANFFNAVYAPFIWACLMRRAPLSEKNSRTSFSLRVIASLMGFNPAAPGAKPLAPAMAEPTPSSLWFSGQKAEANQRVTQLIRQLGPPSRLRWPKRRQHDGQFAANRSEQPPVSQILFLSWPIGIWRLESRRCPWWRRGRQRRAVSNSRRLTATMIRSSPACRREQWRGGLVQPSSPIVADSPYLYCMHRCLRSDPNRKLEPIITALLPPTRLNAVRGFVKSLCLCTGNSLQDSLRLINLLFEFGAEDQIVQAVNDGLHRIRLENWLLVIQQMLARIDSPRDMVNAEIVNILVRSARPIRSVITPFIPASAAHAQAMINPLILAFKSGGTQRRRWNCNKILYNMESHSARLVSEGFMLNEELIRLAITWAEMWTVAQQMRIWEAGQRGSGWPSNEDLLMRRFCSRPLQRVDDEAGPRPCIETAFHAGIRQGAGRSAWSCAPNISGCRHMQELNVAWDIYYNIFRRLGKQ
uniref:FRB_dom domain-containing protein n=1 Tax=Macrostomum lignano TaxID=282301 RepID=A0A1I8JNJ4_9PLAT